VQDASATRISVTNTGAGIPPLELGRIFDRFYRADPARSGNGSSSGLGLAIVTSIMRMHGGQVTVTSQPDALTCFTLRFPATPGSALPGTDFRTKRNQPE